MTNFAKPESQASLHSIASQIGSLVKNQEAQQKLSAETTSTMLTMESAFGSSDPTVVSRVSSARNVFANINAGLKETLQTEEASRVFGFPISDVNLEAASVAIMALGDLDTYKSRLNNMSSGTLNMRDGDVTASPYLQGSAGNVPYSTDVLNMESFSNENLHRFQQINVLSAMANSVQSPFAEALYKTIIKTPEEPAILVEVSRGVVYPAFTYDGTGAKQNFGFKNLLDGISDYTILDTNDTKLVPYKRTETAALLDPTITWNEKIGGVSVPTAPYLIDKEIGYIDISSHPTLLGGGLLNDSDQIDSYISIDSLYVNLEDDGSPSAVVKFNLKGLPTARYVPQYENQDREFFLNFVNETFFLTGASLDQAGAALPSAIATAIGTNKVYFRVRLNGNVNLNQNGGSVSGKIEVIGAKTVAGDDVAGSVLTAIKAALGVVSLRSYTWDARRENNNHRTRGVQVTSHSFREMFRVYTNPPISIIVPTKDAAQASAALKELVNATRTRNDINAVTQALNYIEMIRPHKDHKIGVIPAIQGVGRWYTPVFFDELQLDLDEALQSLNSTQRAQDVTASLLNYVQDIVYRMYARTRYRAAAQYLNSDNVKEVIQITTDPILARHLTRSGDPRLLGEGIETKVEWTYDARWKGIIHVTIVRPTAGDIDPLSHGNFLVIPEVSSVIPKNLNGATVDEVKVVSRTLHINNLPAVGIVRVDMDALSDGLRLKAPIPFEEV